MSIDPETHHCILPTPLLITTFLTAVTPAYTPEQSMLPSRQAFGRGTDGTAAVAPETLAALRPKDIQMRQHKATPVQVDQLNIVLDRLRDVPILTMFSSAFGTFPNTPFRFSIACAARSDKPGSEETMPS